MNDSLKSRSGISRRHVLMGGLAVVGGAAVGYGAMARPKSASDAEMAETLTESFRPVPYWWDELGVAPPSSGELLDEVDFLVVGAGFAGMSAGRTLAGSGAKVLVVDAQRPFYGASSRNCGFFGQAYEHSANLTTPAGAAYYDEFMASSAYLNQMMEEDGIDAKVRAGRYYAASHASDFGELVADVEKVAKSRSIRFEVVEPSRSQEFYNSPTTAHGGVFMPDAPFLQPARLSYGNYLGAVKKGAHFASETRVLDVRRDHDGRFIATTDRGDVRARRVLLTVGGYGARGFNALDEVLPVHAYHIATTPLTPDQMASVMKQPMSMKNSKTNFEIVIPTPDATQLLICGRTAVRYESTEAMAVDLCGLGREMFPQLGDFQATHGWQGIFAMTHDGQKHLFQDAEGVYYLCGDNGSGVGKMQWLGHKAALQMLGSPEGKTLMASNEPPPDFPLYSGGSDWFVPGAVAFYDIRDRLNI